MSKTEKNSKLIHLCSRSGDYNFLNSLTFTVFLSPSKKYIPSSLRCNNCQWFGRHQNNCHATTPTWPCCAGEHHFWNLILNVPTAMVTTWPRTETWNEIVKLKHELNITFPEVHKHIINRTSISYAYAAQKSCKSVATQTEILVSNDQSTNVQQLTETSKSSQAQQSTAAPDKYVHTKLVNKPANNSNKKFNISSMWINLRSLLWDFSTRYTLY